MEDNTLPTQELMHYSPKDRKPPFGAYIECSYDNGKTWDTGTDYRETRTCMFAGYAGGHGYFGEGFATNGENGCDKGLICDDPDLWRFADIETQEYYDSLTHTKLTR